MRAAPLSWLIVSLGTFAIGQAPAGDAALLPRLRALAAECAAARAAVPPLDDADLDLLEAAQIDHEVPPAELAVAVRALRFSATLSADDLPALEAYGATAEGRALTWPLIMMLAQRGRMDLAARRVVAEALATPPADRAQRTWTWWETMFGTRDDYHTMSRDLSLALLLEFEHGDAATRAAVADLLRRQDLTSETVASLRTYVVTAWQRQEDERAAEAQSEQVPPETVWVEDRRGLRQVERRLLWRMRPPSRRELRLTASEPSAPSWGVLVLFEGTVDDLHAKHELLAEIAAFAGDSAGDLDAALGPVEVMLRPTDEPDALRQRIVAVDRAVTELLSVCAVGIAAVEFDLPADGDLRSRTAAMAAEALSGLRMGMRRLAELTAMAARRSPPDPAGDAAAAAALRSAAQRGTALLAELAARSSPAATSSWRDMSFQRRAEGSGDADVHGRTHVVIGRDGVWLTEFAKSDRPDQRPVYLGAKSAILGEASLRGAHFEVSAAGGDSDAGTLWVVPAQPVRWRSAMLPRGDTPAAIRGGRRERLPLECDSAAHCRELQQELERLAAGKLR